MEKLIIEKSFDWGCQIDVSCYRWISKIRVKGLLPECKYKWSLNYADDHSLGVYDNVIDFGQILRNFEKLDKCDPNYELLAPKLEHDIARINNLYKEPISEDDDPRARFISGPRAGDFSILVECNCKWRHCVQIIIYWYKVEPKD